MNVRLTCKCDLLTSSLSEQITNKNASCLKFLTSIDTIQNNPELLIIVFCSFLKHQTSDTPMLKVRLQLPVLELQKYCCRTRVDNITIPVAWAPFCVENSLRAE